MAFEPRNKVRNFCSPASNLLTKNLDADPDEANRTKTVKIHALRILVSLAMAYGLLDAEQTRAAAGPAKSAFVFDGVGYLHRWSMNHQHEFTPEGQEDLEKWSDMITINVYPDAHDGDWQRGRMPFWKITKVTKVRSSGLVPFREHRSSQRSISSRWCLAGQTLSRWRLLALNWWTASDARSCIHIALTARKSATK